MFEKHGQRRIPCNLSFSIYAPCNILISKRGSKESMDGSRPGEKSVQHRAQSPDVLSKMRNIRRSTVRKE
jgi:uncharacterized protein (DUF302 family)